MSAPQSISVTTAGVELVPACAQNARRSVIFLARQDADDRRVLLSFSGSKDFVAANAASWLLPGERMTITPDHGSYPLLVQHGVFAKVASGAAINVQVEY
jgi:hypothetical protein